MKYSISRISLSDKKCDIPYIKFGIGQKNLVVIPGMSFRPLTCMPNGFLSAYKNFYNEYTVYLFDRKANINNAYSIVDMANDTIEAIKELSLDNIYLYGASQGGMIALLIAINCPTLVNKLFIASSSYYVDSRANEIFNKMSSLCNCNDKNVLINYCLNKMYSKRFLNNYKDTIIKSYNDLSLAELLQFKYLCLAYKGINLFEQLNKIKASTFFAASKKDLIFDYNDSICMANKVNCDYYIYENYSHCVYDECPEFINLLNDFFKCD